MMNNQYPGRQQNAPASAGKGISGPGVLLFMVVLLASIGGAIYMASIHVSGGWIAVEVIIPNAVALYVLLSLRIASQWQKAVVLRLGRFRGLKGPGVFWIVPVIDSIPVIIDRRVMVTPFVAEKSLTKDTVSVDVDAVLFWLVVDAQKAALEVADYWAAISWASQTALREIIGQMVLADILVGRSKMDADLQRIIGERTNPWGITVQSVEIRDISIPAGLEDAMSRQAQAERERQARVILGQSEQQIAASFSDAAKEYAGNPTALHLRAMNMLFEGLKEKGALVIVPSSAVDTMNLGAIMGVAALTGTTPPEGGQSQSQPEAQTP